MEPDSRYDPRCVHLDAQPLSQYLDEGSIRSKYTFRHTASRHPERVRSDPSPKFTEESGLAYARLANK
jgi:hypothetical protein